MKSSSDAIGNRNRDLPTCSAVSQPTALFSLNVYRLMHEIWIDQIERPGDIIYVPVLYRHFPDLSQYIYIKRLQLTLMKYRTW